MNTHFIVMMVQIVLLTILWYLITVRRVPFTAASGPTSTGLPDNELLLSSNGKITNSGMVIDDSKPAAANIMWSSEKIMKTIKETTPAAPPVGPAGITETQVNALIAAKLQPRVYFDVSRNNSMKTTGIITYAATLASSGGTAMNLSTGTFTCPTAGLYRITFTALRYYFIEAATPTRILMKRNGTQVATTASTSEIKAIDLSPKPPGGECLSINILLDLNVSDRVYCEIEVGGIYDTADHHVTHFTGELLKAA
jgi:hypothetical protein